MLLQALGIVALNVLTPVNMHTSPTTRNISIFCLNKLGSGVEPSILLYEWVWILGGVYIVFILCVYYDISTSYWVFTQNCSGFH